MDSEIGESRNDTQLDQADLPPSSDTLVAALYQQLLDCWNRRDAHDFAGLFLPDGQVIGFDGSEMNGQVEIEAELARIFADHETATYVGKVKSIKFLPTGTGVLRAIAGMIPPGQSDINPATNALQTLVAVYVEDSWRVMLYQNTPAQFHGRPHMAAALTEELRRLL